MKNVEKKGIFKREALIKLICMIITVSDSPSYEAENTHSAYINMKKAVISYIDQNELFL